MQKANPDGFFHPESLFCAFNRFSHQTVHPCLPSWVGFHLRTDRAVSGDCPPRPIVGETALSCLREIVEREDASDANKIAASSKLIEYGLKLIETFDILRKLDELEKWRDEADGKC